MIRTIDKPLYGGEVFRKTKEEKLASKKAKSEWKKLNPKTKKS